MINQPSLVFFLLGSFFIGFSFYQKNSMEKELLEVYFKHNKENLLKGFEDKWEKYLTKRIQEDIYSKVKTSDSLKTILGPGYFFKVNRNGQLVDRFFPEPSPLKSISWDNIKKLSHQEKKTFLNQTLLGPTTWNRAMIVKYLINEGLKLTEKEKFNLSAYELTLINEQAKNAYKVLFNVLPNKDIFKEVKKVSFNKVFIIPRDNGELVLFIPGKNFIEQKRYFKSFLDEFALSSIDLEADGIKLRLKKDFNPISLKGHITHFYLFSGIVFLILFLYFFQREVRAKNIEATKKISFLNQLVHEVKNPIAGIQVNAQVLLDYGYDQETLEALLTSSKKLNQFFTDIAVINGLNRKPGLSENNLLTKNDLEILVKETCTEFQKNTVIEMKNFTLSKQFKIDLHRLRISLRNIVKNAIYYGKKAEIKISNDQRFLYFEIKDFGPGISILDSRQVFKEFYRANDARKVAPNGVGIGLYIVKKITNEINGDIELLNPGQKHARFLLKVPYEL